MNLTLTYSNIYHSFISSETVDQNAIQGIKHNTHSYMILFPVYLLLTFASMDNHSNIILSDCIQWCSVASSRTDFEETKNNIHSLISLCYHVNKNCCTFVSLNCIQRHAPYGTSMFLQ